VKREVEEIRNRSLLVRAGDVTKNGNTC